MVYARGQRLAGTLVATAARARRWIDVQACVGVDA